MTNFRITIIMLVAFFAMSCVNTQNEKSRETYPFAINISVAEFGHDLIPGEYGKQYTYPTAADLDYVGSKGFELVRVPFKWERLQENLGGPLRDFDLGELKRFVQEAADRNIQVILDLHNYGRYMKEGDHRIIGTYGIEVRHLADFWKKMAIEFRSLPNIYGYALMNEPHDMDPGTSWFEIAQAAIYAIREVDTETTIIVGGDSWSSAQRWMTYSDNLKYLYDPSENLIFEAHVYFDKDNSGTYKYTYEGEEAHPYFGIERVQPFMNWLKVNDFRGFIGEYGIPDNDERWLAALDNFLDYLSRHNVNGAYWAGGPWWPDDHFMAVKPVNGIDRPQMKVLEKHLRTNPR